jgi:hypothetical protein
VTDVKGGENWRITWKLQETAKKCQQTTNRKSWSGYSLTIFSPLGDASVVADAFSRKGWKDQCGKCEQTTIKKLDSVFRMKLFTPLGGASVTACRTLRK